MVARKLLPMAALLLAPSVAFLHHQSTLAQYKLSMSSTVIDMPTNSMNRTSNEPKLCFYKRVDGMWRARKQLNDLFVGERLFANRLPQCDLIDGVTGPKVFLECGVGRLKDNKWIRVNGMLRLGKRTGKKNRVKESVARKKLAKMSEDKMIEVYVSKVNLEHGTFEVCQKKEEALEISKLKAPVSASSLVPGQELSGYVRDVHPYGVFVDVGANRKGLLHISTIASHYDMYINKEEGFRKIGLKPGAKIDVVVLKNEKKRLELGYPPDNVESDEEKETVSSSVEDKAISDPYDISEEEAAAWAANGSSDDSDQYNLSEEEAAMWAAYSNPYSQDDDDDEPDEDREIEDALGIGSW